MSLNPMETSVEHLHPCLSNAPPDPAAHPPFCMLDPGRNRPPNCPYPSHGKLFSVAYGNLRDAEKALDALGELTVWLSANPDAAPAEVVTVLRRICRSTAKRLGREYARSHPSLVRCLAHLPVRRPNPAEAFEAKRLKDRVRDAIKSLEPQHRRVVECTFHRDMTQQELAAVEGVSQQAISKRLDAALDLLGEALSEPATRRTSASRAKK